MEKYIVTYRAFGNNNVQLEKGIQLLSMRKEVLLR